MMRSSKFLEIRDPDKLHSWVMKIRRAIAGWIYQPFDERRRESYAHFFKHEYMIDVHKSYETQIRGLNKGLLKLSKKNKELQRENDRYRKTLAELFPGDEDEN